MVRRTTIGSIEKAVDIVGDKWTPYLLKELAEQGPMRFSDILVLFPRLSERTLSQRLRYLYDEDVISKLPYSTRPLRYRYALSPKGYALVPVLKAMADWQ
jgi:DNA-binding HxlR family transcriptional regulator